MIAEGSSKLASVPSGGAAVASSGAAAGGAAPAAAEEKAEEKKVEEKVGRLYAYIVVLDSDDALFCRRSLTTIWASVSSTKMFVACIMLAPRCIAILSHNLGCHDTC